jgi:hypothetical protein
MGTDAQKLECRLEHAHEFVRKLKQSKAGTDQERARKDGRATSSPDDGGQDRGGEQTSREVAQLAGEPARDPARALQNVIVEDQQQERQRIGKAPEAAGGTQSLSAVILTKYLYFVTEVLID